MRTRTTRKRTQMRCRKERLMRRIKKRKTSGRRKKNGDIRERRRREKVRGRIRRGEEGGREEAGRRKVIGKEWNAGDAWEMRERVWEKMRGILKVKGEGETDTDRLERWERQIGRQTDRCTLRDR